MALLAEEVVEEWLNRNGYFTIRGIKIGVHEIDILAIKPLPNGGHECRHVEVQASINPIAYVSKVPKAIQKKHGIAPDNAKTRSTAMLSQGVAEWVEKKFHHPKKQKMRESLCQGEWSFELVVHRVRHPEELGVFREAGVVIHQLDDIIAEMVERKHLIRSASGNDLVDLILLGREE